MRPLIDFHSAGRQVYKVHPSKTSQICSACGKIGPHKELSERIHLCIHCGVVLDRDENAAVNIYTAWKRPTHWARLCGGRASCVEAPPDHGLGYFTNSTKVTLLANSWDEHCLSLLGWKG